MKVNCSKSLRNKITLFKHHESFLTLKIINSKNFFKIKEYPTLKLGKTPSSRQRLCFALYSPPSAVNITS